MKHSILKKMAFGMLLTGISLTSIKTHACDTYIQIGNFYICKDDQKINLDVDPNSINFGSTDQNNLGSNENRNPHLGGLQLSCEFIVTQDLSCNPRYDECLKEYNEAVYENCIKEHPDKEIVCEFSKVPPHACNK